MPVIVIVSVIDSIFSCCNYQFQSYYSSGLPSSPSPSPSPSQTTRRHHFFSSLFINNANPGHPRPRPRQRPELHARHGGGAGKKEVKVHISGTSRTSSTTHGLDRTRRPIRPQVLLPCCLQAVDLHQTCCPHSGRCASSSSSSSTISPCAVLCSLCRRCAPRLCCLGPVLRCRQCLSSHPTSTTAAATALVHCPPVQPTSRLWSRSKSPPTTATARGSPKTEDRRARLRSVDSGLYQAGPPLCT